MRGEPCLCGAPDCPHCFPWSYKEFRRRAAHEDHEDPSLEPDECPECRSIEDQQQARAEAEYDRRKEEGLYRWDS